MLYPILYENEFCTKMNSVRKSNLYESQTLLDIHCSCIPWFDCFVCCPPIADDLLHSLVHHLWQRLWIGAESPETVKALEDLEIALMKMTIADSHSAQRKMRAVSFGELTAREWRSALIVDGIASGENVTATLSKLRECIGGRQIVAETHKVVSCNSAQQRMIVFVFANGADRDQSFLSLRKLKDQYDFKIAHNEMYV